MKKPRGRFRRKSQTSEKNIERGTDSPTKRVDVGMTHTLPDFEVKGRSARYKDVRRGRATAAQEMKARYRRSRGY